MIVAAAYRISEESKAVINKANNKGKGKTMGSILEAFARALESGRLEYKNDEIVIVGGEENVKEVEKIVEKPVEKIVERIIEKPVPGNGYNYDLQPLIEYAARNRVTVQSFINSLSKM